MFLQHENAFAEEFSIPNAKDSPAMTVLIASAIDGREN
jgi:hypothetical protein